MTRRLGCVPVRAWGRVLGLIALCGSGSCTESPARDDAPSQPPERSSAVETTLARVGDAALGRKELEAFVASFAGGEGESLRDSLERLVRQELCAQQAEREGYLAAPAVRAAERADLARRVPSALAGDAKARAEQAGRIERAGADAADHAALDRVWLAITAAANRALAPRAGVPERTLGMDAADGAVVLAKVGGAQLTAADFLELYRRLHPAMKEEYNRLEKRQAALAALAAETALAEEARRRNLQREPASRQVVRAALARAWLQDALASANAGEPAEVELRSYYDRHEDAFDQPAQIQLDQLLFRRAEQAEAALARLEADRAAHRWFTDARDLEGAVAGTLPFVAADGRQEPPQPKVPAALIAPGFELVSAGDLYPRVLASERGYHVIRLAARRARIEQSFESARGALRRAVVEERRAQREAAVLASLRRDLGVTVDEAALQRLQSQQP